MNHGDHWTRVATASSQVEAALLRDLLVGEGIASLVQTSDAAAYLGVISPCVLLVRQDDLERASAFLDAWHTAEPAIPEEEVDTEHDPYS